MTTLSTLTIDADKLGAFTKRVGQMQRKAVKLGFEPISITVGPVFEREATATTIEAGIIFKSLVIVREVNVEIEGTLPVFNGWNVLCKIEHTAEGNLVHGDTDHLTVEQIKNFKPVCHHCNQTRDRKATFILTHKDGGSMQVGGSCLKDFTRSESPAAEFNYGVELVGFLNDEDIWAVDGSSQTYSGYDIVTLLSVALDIVRHEGYVSSNDWNGPSTKELTLNSLNKKVAAENVTKDDNKARELIDWALAQEADSAYMQNCHVLLNAGVVSSKNAGYLIGLIPSKMRADARAAQELADANAINEHVGSVKERLRGLKLTVQMIRYFDGMYGTTSMLVLRDAEGRTYKWMASGTSELDQGNTVVLDGTVKAHEEYNGTMQTVLTRCKIKETA